MSPGVDCDTCRHLQRAQCWITGSFLPVLGSSSGQLELDGCPDTRVRAVGEGMSRPCCAQIPLSASPPRPLSQVALVLPPCGCTHGDGRYVVEAGVLHLSCASTHLTAFWGAAGGATARFSVNNVHPIDDAGDLKACSP